MNEAVDAIRGMLRRLRIVPYDERTGAGELRYLQLTAVGTQAGAPAAQRDPRASVQVIGCGARLWCSAARGFALLHEVVH